MPRLMTIQQYTLAVCILMQTPALMASSAQDPMRPPNFSEAKTSASSPEWKVAEILIADERRIAIINDKPVKPGDRINGAKVVSIDTSYVTLSYKNKIFKRYLSRIPVKQRTLPGKD